ncbi:MAG: fibronectin type III domain-containing protein [Anaerolineae bacterium]
MRALKSRVALRLVSSLFVLAVLAFGAVGAQGALAQGTAQQPAGMAAGGTPTAPSNVAALPLNTTQIRVTWSDNSTNEDGFRIFDGAPPTPILAGTVGAGVTTFLVTGLTPGSFHCYWVEAYNTYGSSPSPTTSCTSTPNTDVGPGPSAPSNLLATPTATTQIRLTWVDNSSNENGFKVYEDGSSTSLATVGANVTTFTVTGVTPGTYHCYHVTAYNAQGESGPSGSDCAQTSLTPPVGVPPAAPTGMTATGISQSEIQVAWIDNSNDEQGFRIYESNSLVATVGADVTAYTVGGLAAGSSHCYQVASYNSYGETVANGMACGSTQTAPPGPSAPANLQAAALSTTQIKLTWTDTSTNETGFKVFEGSTLVATLSAGTTTYTVSGLAANTNHCYVVYAYNGNGTSAPSNQACATTQSGSASKLPSAPSNLQASAMSASQIKLTWTDTSTNETGFKIFEGTRQVATVGLGVTTYTVSGLAANSNHCYQVASYNSYGTSAYSNTACATTSSSSGSVPASPTSVGATAISTSRIRITWTDASTNETGFKVYEGTTLLGTVGAGVTTYTAGGMTAATYHCYQVVAYNSAGDSAPSAQTCTMTASWPDDLIVTQPLTLSTTSAMRGTTVIARFKVRNNGQVDMVVSDLAASARLGTDWTGTNYDFPHVTNLTLHPGQEYSYQQQRPFTAAGSYFAEQTAQLPSGGGIYPTNRVTFRVW